MDKFVFALISETLTRLAFKMTFYCHTLISSWITPLATRFYHSWTWTRLAKEDQEKTSFTTPWGTYCYVVMPFGLKNAGAAYQRTMTAIFP